MFTGGYFQGGQYFAGAGAGGVNPAPYPHKSFPPAKPKRANPYKKGYTRGNPYLKPRQPKARNVPMQNMSQRYYNHKNGAFGTKGMPAPSIPYRKAARLAAKALGFGLKMNPYVRGVSYAFDVYDMYNSNLWGYAGTPIPGADIGQILIADGWTKCCDSGGPTVNTFQNIPGSSCKLYGEICDFALGCPTALQVPTGDIATQAISYGSNSGCSSVRTRTYGIGLGYRTSTVPSRHTVTQVWGKQWPNSGAVPRVTLPLPQPAVNRPVIPQPITPPPLPVIQESVSGGGAAAPPRVPPYALPAAVWPIGSKPRPGVHYRVPPYRGHRERKTNANLRQALAILSKGYGGVTEMNDAVNAIYDALGQKCAGAKGMREKIACIYTNLPTLDGPQAVRNLVYNHYTDKYAGRIFGAAGKHSPFGVMTSAMGGP